MIYNMRRRKKKAQMSFTWYFNPQPSIVRNYTYTAIFTSNGIKFISLNTSTSSFAGGILYGDKDLVYLLSERKWANRAYRTVVFDEAPTGELLAFLQANATPL